MRIGNVFPSEFLKASDLGGFDAHKHFTVKIADVKAWQDPTGKPKLSIGFEKTQKRLIANITNARIIAKAYGEETDAWVGKTIVLFVQMVDFKGDSVEAIRCRVPQGKAGEGAQASQPSSQPTGASAGSPTAKAGNSAGDFHSEVDPPPVDKLDAFGLPPNSFSDDMDDEIPF